MGSGNYDSAGNVRMALRDASGTELSVSTYHAGDDQNVAAAGGSLLASGIAQILNATGNADRQRETGFDGIPAAGVATGTQQLAEAPLNTTINQVAGVTASASPQTVTLTAVSQTSRGVTSSIQVGSTISVDTGASQEYVFVTAVNTGAVTVTGIFAKSHSNGAAVSAFTYNQARDATVGDGATPAGLAANALYNFNGATFDTQRGNLDNIIVLASAARTTTQTQADQTNFNHRGIIVVLDMTTVGTGSVTLEIDAKDPVSGKYYAILTGAAVTTNGTNIYRVYPGLTASANATANDILPRTWRCKVTANNANSATYSVGAMLIV